MTGLQAGANISGDLKDPARSIPKGTLLALLISAISYAVFVIFAGGAAARDAPGLINGTIPSVVDCLATKVSKRLVVGCFLFSTSTLNLNQSFSDLWIRPTQFIHNYATDVSIEWTHLCRLLGGNTEHRTNKSIVSATTDSSIGNRSNLSGPNFLLKRLWQTRRTISWICPNIFHFIDIFIDRYVNWYCSMKNRIPNAVYSTDFGIFPIYFSANLNLIAPLISNFYLASYGMKNSFAYKSFPICLTRIILTIELDSQIFMKLSVSSLLRSVLGSSNWRTPG